MTPTLRAGDRVVALRWPRPLPVPPGAVVAVRDPRDGFRVMVKRVAGRTPDGVVVAGDNAARSTDSRAFGPVPRRLVVGVVLYRYHPEGHTGWVARRRGDAGTAVSAARQ